MKYSNDLREAIYKFIHESVSVQEMPEDLLAAASVDSQIDEFLITAEKNANEMAKKEEELRAERLSVLAGTLLNEEDKEQEGAPLLDITAFSQEVSRLVHNHNNLLDVPSTIVNRAIAFLAKNYDADTVEEFKQILSSNFDIDLTMSGKEDSLDRPLAAGSLGSTGA